MHSGLPSPKEKNKKENSDRCRSSSSSPTKKSQSRRAFPDSTTPSPESGSVSPNTEYRLTQERLKEYEKRQQGLAEKNRRRVADAIALAIKYIKGPLTVPEVSVKDFLRACENEANQRRKKTCQRKSYFIQSPEYCQTEEGCIQCQVNQLRDGLNQIYPSNKYRCELHRYSPNMDGAGERQSPNPTPVSICRRIELMSRASSGKTPPPVPVSTPRGFSVISPEPGIQTGFGFTPDSEYDNCQRNELINRYIPKPKVVHYQCRPRTRMFLYTDKAKSCNVVHHPYAVYRGKKSIIDPVRKKRDFIQKYKFKIHKLGVAYTLPDINPNLGPRRTPSPSTQPPSIHWNKSAALPPIKGRRMGSRDS